MRVDLGRDHVAATEKFLHGADVEAFLVAMRPRDISLLGPAAVVAGADRVPNVAEQARVPCRRIASLTRRDAPRAGR
jgi:hypothetical protein